MLNPFIRVQKAIGSERAIRSDVQNFTEHVSGVNILPDKDQMLAEKAYHHGNLKEALVKASLDILHKDGLTGMSLRKCEERVGVSHTAPKNHFGNMAGLLTALASTGYAMLADYMRRDWAEDSLRPERRDLALQGYVTFAVDHPDLFELMFARGRTKSGDPELMGNVVACFAVLADISKDLPLGHLNDELTDTRAQMFIWSAVHGYAQLSIAGRFKKDEMKRLTILDILPQMEF